MSPSVMAIGTNIDGRSRIALSELPDADRMGVGGGSVRATGKTRSTAQYSRWEMVNALRGAQRLHGACCRTSFRPGRMCIAPSGAGLREASSSKCMIGCLWRSREERAPEPSAAVLDAQSTRSSPQGGPSGYDAGKKVKGRKRNLVVDTLGLLLMVNVVPANVQDRDGADHVVRAAVDSIQSRSCMSIAATPAPAPCTSSRSTRLTWRWFGIRPIATWAAG